MPTANRPKKPEKSENYPTIPMIANKRLKNFVNRHPQIKIEAVTADALYGHAAFMDEASKITGNAQVVSQIRSNQNILIRKNKKSVKRYFKARQPIKTLIKVRGGNEVPVYIDSARLFVSAHQKKRFVIALR